MFELATDRKRLISLTYVDVGDPELDAGSRAGQGVKACRRRKRTHLLHLRTHIHARPP